MHDDDLRHVVRRTQDLLEEIEEAADDSLRQTVFELLQHVDTIHREGLSRLRSMLRAAGQGQLLEKAAQDDAVGLLLELYDLHPAPAPSDPGAKNGRSFVPLEAVGVGRRETEPTAGSTDERRPERPAAGPDGRQAGFHALVAGVGNELRGDDGFGLAVLRRLAERELPEGTELQEVGIGGIHLVQQLMGNGYDALVIVDAVDRDGDPGQLYELEADVPDPTDDRDGRLTEVDLHQTDPSRVLLMARAMDVLPPRVRIVGCQAQATGLSESMSEPVQGAVSPAADRIALLLQEWSHEYTRTGTAESAPGSRSTGRIS